MAATVWLCVLAAAPAKAAPGSQLVIAAEEAALRAAPDGAAATVLLLTPAHRLVEFERRDGWVRVGVFGVVGAFGWLPQSQVTAPPEPEPEPEPVVVLPPPPPPYRLDVTGTPAVQFRGKCTLVDRAGRYRDLKISGLIPKSYAFDKAAAVACVVQKWDSFGRLRARLSIGQERLVTRSTRAPFNFVRVRTAGPWGSGGGAIGNIPTFRVKRPVDKSPLVGP